MINRAQVSVDDATRDVLQELSAELDREPVWANQLRTDLGGTLEEVVDDRLMPLHRHIEQLSAAIEASGRQSERFAELLADQQSTMHQLELRAAEHSSSFATLEDHGGTRMREIIEQLQSVNAAVAEQREQLAALSAQIELMSLPWWKRMFRGFRD